MAEEQERERSRDTTEQNREWDEETRAAGNRDGLSPEEAKNTPPGGDVRAIYSHDRAAGEAEPDPQPS